MDYVNSVKENIKNTISPEKINESLASVQNSLSSVKQSISGSLSEFSSKGVLNAGSEFLNSNSIIAKFVFLILILTVFMFLLSLGSYLLVYIFSPNTSPYLVSGMISGSSAIVIPQDPANTNSAVIYRSNNQNTGIEFTWSAWLLINSFAKYDATPNAKVYYNVFNKGDTIYNPNGIASVNNGPGLYVGPTDSNGNGHLTFIMNVVSPDKSDQVNDVKLDIPNIPLQKWFHVAFRLQNKVLDAYVNGTIQNRVSFDTYIPKQNYDNVNICQNGGFTGSLSNLRYFDYALSVFDLNSIVSYGPNLNASSAVKTNKGYDYLSRGWYSNIFPNA